MDMSKGAEHAWNYLDRDFSFGTSWGAATVVA
jgi:hypothetical protein